MNMSRENHRRKLSSSTHCPCWLKAWSLLNKQFPALAHRSYMALHKVWAIAAKGRMAPMEQAKLWALRTVLRKQCEDDDQFQWMADEVHVVGGGHPTRQSVRDFSARVDEDAAAWYPGRATQKTGRPVEMTPLKRKSLASSMRLPRSAGCYNSVCLHSMY